MDVQVIVRPVADDVLFLIRDEFHKGTVGDALTDSLEVRVIDRGGLPVPGIAVSFDIEAGSGSVSPRVVTTNSAGYARAEWTLGTEVGTNVVAVFDGAASPVADPSGAAAQGSPKSKVHAWGRAGTPYAVLVSPSTDTLGLFDTNRLVATVVDKWDNVLEDIPLEWTSSNSDVVDVDEAGRVLGQAEGDATVSAKVVSSATVGSGGQAPPPSSPAGSAVIRVRRPAATTLVRTSGTGQSGPVGETLPEPLVVLVSDADGAPLAGVDVTWSVSAGAGSLNKTTTRTDGTGSTAVEWTLGTSPGQQEVSVWAAGTGSVTFSATAQIGEPAEVSVTPSSLELEAGESHQFSAKVYDRYGNRILGRPVEWRTTNAAVVKVDVGGYATALGGGTAAIKAKLDGASGSATVQVSGSGSGGVGWRVAVIPGNASLNALGAEVNLAATVTDENGSVVGGAQVAWSSLNPEVANVDDFGRVTSHAVGVAMIMATAATGAADTAVVDSRQVAAVVDLTPTEVRLEGRQTAQFAVEAFDSLGSPIPDAEFTWTSTDEAVATVSPTGLMEAGQPGTATIVARSGSFTGWATATVDPIPVGSITISPEHLALEVGTSETAEVELRDVEGVVIQRPDVAWTSSDPSVATVEAGVISALAPGAAEIVASVDGKSATMTVSVTGTSQPPTGIRAAFPGAEGWGATALEACRDKPLQVLRVTNTNSDGSGSFAQAVSDVRSDRFSVIVFETGGHIITPSSTGIRVSASCVYIAGQTAPGDGIVIEGRPTAFWLRGGGDDITDVVMRYLRFRGKSGVTQNNMIIAKGQRVVLDHMSFSWTDNYPLAIIRYGGTSFSGRIADLSIQHTIVSEAFATHPTGLTINTNAELKPAKSIDMTNISIHRNLLANNSHRNPMTAADNALVANNVIYNWRLGAGMMNRRGSVDWVNNFAKPGPMTGDVHTYMVNPYCDALGGDFSIYAAGNVGPRSGDPNGDNWSGSTRQVSCYRGSGDYDGQEVPPSWRRSSEQPWRGIANAVALRTAEQAYNAVVADVGANERLTCDGRWTGALDPADSRVISETRNGSGPSSPPSDEGAVGGYPSYSRGTGCTDQDGDGLPDAWEQRFYDCSTCADAAAPGRDGYLLMEHYVNGTDPT
jgi:uncharacterized protein YjdB